MMTEAEFRAKVRAMCKEGGGIAAWGAAHGFARSYVSDVINDGTPPSKRFLDAVQMDRVISYRERAIDHRSLSRVAALGELVRLGQEIEKEPAP